MVRNQAAWRWPCRNLIPSLSDIGPWDASDTCVTNETFGDFGDLFSVNSEPQAPETIVVEVPSVGCTPVRKMMGTLRSTFGKDLIIGCPETIDGACSIRVQSAHFLFVGDVLQSVPDEESWTVHVTVTSKLLIF